MEKARLEKARLALRTVQLVSADIKRLLPGQLTLPSMSCVTASATAVLRSKKTADPTAATKLHRMSVSTMLWSVLVSDGTSTSFSSEELRGS